MTSADGSSIGMLLGGKECRLLANNFVRGSVCEGSGCCLSVLCLASDLRIVVMSSPVGSGVSGLNNPG